MLSSHASSNPLFRLKRNASREVKLVLAGMALIVFDALLFFRHSAKMQLFAAGVFVVLGVVGLIVYQRQQLISQMEQQHDNLYQFLNSRIGRFRRLMRLHDYVGVIALLLLMLTVLVVRWEFVWTYLAPAHPEWGWHMGIAGGVVVALLALVYAAYAIGKKEHQRRYGKYLDQLEGALRELRD